MTVVIDGTTGIDTGTGSLIAADATTPTYLDLFEDTDNGSNYVRLIAPASIAANRTITLPDATGTLMVNTISNIASYQWTAWNPTNITGTVTTAPSTGTSDDSNYVTMSNSSGTLTVTFDVAGTYLVCINGMTTHSQVYTFDTWYANLGGTATRRVGRDDPNNWGNSVDDGNIFMTLSFYVSATAGQTLTIQPQYRLSGSGTTANHTAYCNATIQYCGG